MGTRTLTVELSNALSLPEKELIRKGLLALVQKEIRLAEREIAIIRERYDVFSKEALFRAIQTGSIVEHPAWEDYIVWNNQETHIERLRRLVEND